MLIGMQTFSSSGAMLEGTVTGLKERPSQFRESSPSVWQTTSASLRIKAVQEGQAPQGTEDTLVSEVSGVVLRIDKDRVRVRLAGKVIVNFPIMLFEKKDFVRLGQPIRYQIKRTFDGIRYQDFQSDEAPSLSSAQTEILNLLESIESRDE